MVITSNIFSFQKFLIPPLPLSSSFLLEDELTHFCCSKNDPLGKNSWKSACGASISSLYPSWPSISVPLWGGALLLAPASLFSRRWPLTPYSSSGIPVIISPPLFFLLFPSISPSLQNSCTFPVHLTAKIIHCWSNKTKTFPFLLAPVPLSQLLSKTTIYFYWWNFPHFHSFP